MTSVFIQSPRCSVSALPRTSAGLNNQGVSHSGGRPFCWWRPTDSWASAGPCLQLADADIHVHGAAFLGRLLAARGGLGFQSALFLGGRLARPGILQMVLAGLTAAGGAAGGREHGRNGKAA